MLSLLRFFPMIYLIIMAVPRGALNRVLISSYTYTIYYNTNFKFASSRSICSTRSIVSCTCPRSSTLSSTSLDNYWVSTLSGLAFYKFELLQVCTFTSVSFYNFFFLQVWTFTSVSFYNFFLFTSLNFYMYELLQVWTFTSVSFYKCELLQVWTFTSSAFNSKSSAFYQLPVGAGKSVLLFQLHGNSTFFKFLELFVTLLRSFEIFKRALSQIWSPIIN